VTCCSSTTSSSMDKKESLQEELFHTFNSLYGFVQADRPHVRSCTARNRHFGRPPPEQAVVGLTMTSNSRIETRIAILRTKAEHEHAVVGDDVLDPHRHQGQETHSRA